MTQKPIPKPVKFLFGGTSGMAATFFVQPLDLVKNRMQMSGVGGAAKAYKSSFHAIRSIVQKEGIFALYNGCYDIAPQILLTCFFMQQAIAGEVKSSSPCNCALTFDLKVASSVEKNQFLYDGAKIISRPFTSGNVHHYQAWADGKPPAFLVKAGIGMTAGAIGAFVGTPADLSLIRMTSDGRLPLDQRRGYTSVFNALARITKEEGFFALWRGCGPTVTRAMVVNAAQLASYSQAKQFLLGTGYFRDNIGCHFGASMISGLVTTIASMPVDIAKTRIQNMKIIDGKPEYKGSLEVLYRTVTKEGIFSLWKGFTPYYVRLGPHTVLTFIALEQLNAGYRRYFSS